MKQYAGKRAFVGLLLMAVALLASGCASDGTSSYSQTEVGYGYYGVYGPEYYHDHDHYDVTVNPPPSSAASPRPPADRPSAPPHVSQLPSRPLPSPAPRPTPRPASRPAPRPAPRRR